jgi:heme a synthase
MSSFRKLATATIVATILLVAIGGLVRATGSGLGCGDHWPQCNGRLIPVLNAKPVIIEYSHRVVAGIVGLMTLALFVHAVRTLRSYRAIVQATGLALMLVVVQALLGRVVVVEELEVYLVVGHLMTAMLFLASLIVVVVLARRAEGRWESAPPDRALSQAMLVAAGAALVLLMVGSYTSDFGYVPGWPLQDGRPIPALGQEHQAVHFLHRSMAAIVGVIVAFAALRIIRDRERVPTAARLARFSVGLFAIEIFIGALNVWTELNAVVVALHLTVGSLVWASLVGAAAVTSPGLVAAARAVPRARTTPVHVPD